MQMLRAEVADEDAETEAALEAGMGVGADLEGEGEVGAVDRRGGMTVLHHRVVTSLQNKTEDPQILLSFTPSVGECWEWLVSEEVE